MGFSLALGDILDATPLLSRMSGSETVRANRWVVVPGVCGAFEGLHMQNIQYK
jgi:hypothetical protein